MKNFTIWDHTIWDGQAETKAILESLSGDVTRQSVSKQL